MCLTGDTSGFGIFGGNACFCIYNHNEGHYLEGRESGICDLPCSGDASLEMCGGNNAFELYQVFYDVPEGAINDAGRSVGGTAPAIMDAVKTDFGKSQEDVMGFLTGRVREQRSGTIAYIL